MATTFELKAKIRQETGRQVKQLREQGLIPAVIYGNGIKSQNLVVEYNPFANVFKKSGASSLVDLSIDGGAPVKVLVYEVTQDPLSDRWSHIDFYQVKMTEKLRTKIPLKFIGEAPAIKELGGMFVKGFDEIEVECLPSDLVSEIEVDISTLKTFTDTLHLKDLKLPKGIELVLKTNEVLAKVAAPRSEEELKALEEKPEEKVEEIKTVADEKKAAKAVEEAAAAEAEKPEKKEKK